MIDWSRVHELRDEIGPEDFDDIVGLFIDEVDTVMATLDAAMPDIEDQLHFLKGSALNLGFASFADYCQEGELAASQGQSNPVNVEKLHDIYRASRAEFYAGLEQRKTG